MIITFFAKDGQFTTDKFETTEEAREYLSSDINPVMIQDIPSTGQKRAAIFIPNAEIGIFAHEEHKNSIKHKPLHKSKNKDKVVDLFRIDEEPVSIENANSEDFSDDAMKELLKMMEATPEQIEDLESRRQEKEEAANIKYRYFVDHVKTLYGDPNWKDCQDRYDQEFKENY